MWIQPHSRLGQLGSGIRGHSDEERRRLSHLGNENQRRDLRATDTPGICVRRRRQFLWLRQLHSLANSTAFRAAAMAESNSRRKKWLFVGWHIGGNVLPVTL